MSPPLRRISPFVDVDFALRRQFNKTSFRYIIVAALEGYDVVVQAATGFGKSLCFQLPAVINSGVTIVVAPLLSLMINQVEALHAARIDARTLNGCTPPADKADIYRDLGSAHPRTRLLYVTPELCSSSRFRRHMQLVHRQCELARVVIDEAHCISEWGHDFRRDFAQLGWFRASFPNVPIMCLTATANEPVLRDILDTVRLARRDAPQGPRLKMFRLSPFRPNLHLAVRFLASNDDGDQHRFADFATWYKDAQKNELARHQRRKRGRLLVRAASTAREPPATVVVSGIIYTLSRNECELLATALQSEGIGARPFHAQLSRDAKEETMARWLSDDPDWAVIVATTAFGMGVDKLTVRFVVHWRLSKSFEGYCQEIGRAGRDGLPASCILYYSRGDGERISSFVARSNTRAMASKHHAARRASLKRLVEYCEDTDGCRHAAVCAYFGFAHGAACRYACDWHTDAKALKAQKRKQLGEEAWASGAVFSQVDECDDIDG
ncbi:hypothetical protein HMPREF1624_07971 [Sporothrix schenckii ATCC 58251]|uniref:ATP-dependent DNA helicase n=1 Tax=Sporothrix schenckii (strain ATCC 58251 / de Perez 2211183) TaxID=1391915 RepID=U7PMG1_SPOS1|nr:hypothetical protein HMPREF1624_07971 [Sporothrix schenckii ATCC 58251]